MKFVDAHGMFVARMWDPALAWSQVTPSERLRVPIGKTPFGQTVWLDINVATTEVC